ncbi:MAG: M20/M25/M40 family metallo-hydrolase [Deltaproteobacteria bacterium]|nr:M20/M25/M40 family metallo-hydrolase [Deltaproteobacteria bacterium]
MRPHRLAALGSLPVVVLAGIVAYRTASLPDPVAAPAPVRIAVDADALSRGLAEAVRFRTVSVPVDGRDAEAEWQGFHAWLAGRFPRVHTQLAREIVGGRSLLFTWRGADPALAPVALLAHQDVVPAEEGPSSGWAHPPFAGAIVDGVLWGRGTIDDKAGVVGILEACEQLLGQGFAPRRTVLRAFGHDEEASGHAGAGAIAETLASRGVTLDFVLDEGGYVTEGAVPGVARPVAVVGMAEKGAAYVELSARNPGPAHSSSPARDNPVARLARALVQIDEHPWPTRLVPAARGFFDAIATETSGLSRVALANLWLFEPVVRWRLTGTAATNAMIRTTAVGTRLQGGVKDSAIPDVARAVVSIRILPGESVAAALERLLTVVNDSRIDIKVLRAREPSPTSPANSAAFALVRHTIREVFPDAVVAPVLATGGTDARFYTGLTPNVFRFAPVRGTVEQLGRAHGVDEHIAVTVYADAVRFYLQLIQNAAAGRAAE